jgi:hypothetical protein
MKALQVRLAPALIQAFRPKPLWIRWAALLSSHRLRSSASTLRGYLLGPMIALGRLATAPSCLSKLRLRPYPVAQMPLRRRLPPSLTVLFPYAEPRQE